jgi:H+-translocating NAD(P) transhydrogenase subunit alpha
MDFLSILSIFVLACFVGYFVVWSVTPALHTPLMAVTNAISSVIIVGALIAAAAGSGGGAGTGPVATVTDREIVAVDRDVSPTGSAVAAQVLVTPAAPPAGWGGSGQGWAKWLGLLGVVLASINIFGGFAVTARMLAMYKKKVK